MSIYLSYFIKQARSHLIGEKLSVPAPFDPHRILRNYGFSSKKKRSERHKHRPLEATNPYSEHQFYVFWTWYNLMRLSWTSLVESFFSSGAGGGRTCRVLILQRASTCCGFQPAFGLLGHPKAGGNTVSWPHVIQIILGRYFDPLLHPLFWTILTWKIQSSL